MPKESDARHHSGEITLLLSDINNPNALRTVLGLAYRELHDIAVHYVRNERPGGSLQPTTLLHEACLRLIKKGAAFKNRRYFFAAAATAMRRVLVDGARRRGATKRGGDYLQVDFSEAERIGFEERGELLDFDAALTRLAAEQPRWSEIVELRVFGGCSTAEAASLLGIGASTARKRWTSAKRWLHAALRARGRTAAHGDRNTAPAPKPRL